MIVSGCGAASRQPNTDAPRPPQPPYPVLISGSEDRRQNTLRAWRELISEQGIEAAAAPELQPVTATVRSLPTASGALTVRLQLPRVGDSETLQSPEATREALRRFINRAAPLLGVEPETLSLLEVKQEPSGATARARYAQRAFPYPLRGGYGIVEITFDSSRNVRDMFSTALPDAEQLRRRLAPLRPQLTPEQATVKLADQPLTFADAAGVQQTLTVTPQTTVTARELVLLPLTPGGAANALEIHLAWECTIESSVPLAVYVDAINGTILAVMRQRAATGESS